MEEAAHVAPTRLHGVPTQGHSIREDTLQRATRSGLIRPWCDRAGCTRTRSYIVAHGGPVVCGGPAGVLVHFVVEGGGGGGVSTIKITWADTRAAQRRRPGCPVPLLLRRGRSLLLPSFFLLVFLSVVLVFFFSFHPPAQPPFVSLCQVHDVPPRSLPTLFTIPATCVQVHASLARFKGTLDHSPSRSDQFPD